MHARCLSVSVKKQLKEGNIVKCPSCARPFWTQQEDKSQDSNDIGDDANELSPVALQLYKYLLNHGDWWGQALISNNGNVCYKLSSCILLCVYLKYIHLFIYTHIFK